MIGFIRKWNFTSVIKILILLCLLILINESVIAEKDRKKIKRESTGSRTFMEAVCLRSNLKSVATKIIYTSRIKDLLLPPKAEMKLPLVNYKELIYPRLQN